MKVWADGQCFQTGSRDRGIGRYAFGFISELAKRTDVDVHISFNAAMPDELIGARNVLKGIIPNGNMHSWHGVASSGEGLGGFDKHRELSEIALANHIDQLGPDVALSLSPFEGVGDLSVPLLKNICQAALFATVVYDFIPMHYSDQLLRSSPSREAYFRRIRSVQQSDVALCISEHTKTDLLNQGYRGKAIAIMAGLDSTFVEAAKSIEAASRQSRSRQLIYIGSLDPHKNCSAIVRALSFLTPAERPELFIFAGSRNTAQVEELKAEAATYGLPIDLIRFDGHLSNKRLLELYQSSMGLVHPSFIEGFGLTPLEAMHAGLPVICTQGGALAEVVGNAGLTFDPHSPADLADKMRHILNDANSWNEIQQKGLARAASFTWERSVDAALGACKPKLRSTQVDHIDRERIAELTRLNTAEFEKKVMALALSDVEPMDQTLLVDITQTSRTDAETGIQRVVRNIVNNLEAGCVPFGESVGSVVIGPDRKLRVRNTCRGYEKGEIIRPRRGSVILWLDSSWEFADLIEHRAMQTRCHGGRSVSVLYDLVPAIAPAFCGEPTTTAYNRWLLKALLFSDAFMCISRAVADELHEFLKAIRFPRHLDIGYWRLGADLADASLEGNRDTQFPGRQRLLMVGTIEPRKGYDVALDACSRLWLDGLNFELHLVGRPGWHVDNLTASIRNHPEFGTRLHWHHSASDKELSHQYRSADFLIAASYAEGFGLPIVEAERFGVEVVASDIPVFREVADPLTTRFFAVGNAASLAEKIAETILNGRTGERASERGKVITWSESAEQLADIVCNERWYTTYVPESPIYEAVHDPADLIRMSAPIAHPERKFTARLEGIPELSTNRQAVRVRVRVRNLSERFWSSIGRPDGALAVNAAFQVHADDGRPISVDEPLRQPLVQALIPNTDYIISLDVPKDQFQRGRKIHFTFVQEKVAFWEWVELSIPAAIGGYRP